MCVQLGLGLFVCEQSAYVCVCVCVVAWWRLLAVPSGSAGSCVESGKPHLIKAEAAQCSTRTEHYWECRSGKPWAWAHMLAAKPLSLFSLSFLFPLILHVLIFHLVRDKKEEDKIDSVGDSGGDSQSQTSADSNSMCVYRTAEWAVTGHGTGWCGGHLVHSGCLERGRGWGVGR